MTKHKKLLPTPMRYDRRYKIKPQSKRNKVISLFERGLTITKLAKKFKVSYQTIHRIVDEKFRLKANALSRITSIFYAKENPDQHTQKVQNSLKYVISIQQQSKKHYAKGLAQNA